MELSSTKYPNNVRTLTAGTHTIYKDDVSLNCNTSGGAIIINLGTIPDNYWSTTYKLYVVDSSATSSTNNITINAGAGQTINNLPSYTINTNGAGIIIQILSNNSYVVTSINNLILTTNGSAGPSTLTGNVLNIPVYNAGAGCGIIALTNEQLQNLIDTGTVVQGMYYLVTDCLNADEGVLVQGVLTNSTTTLQGTGIFLNADYQAVGNYSGVPGYAGNLNVYGDVARPVVANNVVIWNNLHYKNLTGNWGIDPNLDPTNWVLLSKSTTNGYIREVDFIKYNVRTNRVIYRADKRLNEVDYASFGSSNNILEFQWGKDRVTGNKLKGVGRMTCTNSYATFTNNLIEGTITDSTQLFDGLIGSYVSNIISNDSYITCDNYNRGIIKNNIIQSGGYITLNTNNNNCQISDNAVNRNSYINIGTVSGYSFVTNNEVTQNAYLDIVSMDGAEVRSNEVRQGSYIQINTMLNNSYIRYNVVSNQSFLISGNTDNGTIDYNSVIDNSQFSILNNTNRSEGNTISSQSIVTINNVIAGFTANNVTTLSNIQITSVNAFFWYNNISNTRITITDLNFQFEYNTLFQSQFLVGSVVGGDFRSNNLNMFTIQGAVLSYRMQNNTLNNYYLETIYLQNNVGSVELSLSYSNLQYIIDMNNPAFYNVGTQTLTLVGDGIFGRFILQNSSGKVIRKIAYMYNPQRPIRFYTETDVTFQHTTVATSTSGDLLCDAPASANNLIGRTYGSDFIEYELSALGQYQFNYLRTNLVKLA